MSEQSAASVRLNLGGGINPIAGYDNSIDAVNGKRAYPLEVADDSVDELRASHIFEHFSHMQALAVLKDWVRALKPGGLLKLAVPDLDYIARGYLDGKREAWQQYLCGSHSDANDVHLAQYDHVNLAALMRMAGLVGVHKWQGAGDCSALPVSLNLAAWKPPAVWPKVIGVMSVPRLGFMDNFFCATELIARLRMPFRKTTGAFWGQCMTRSIEESLAEGCEWILTMDYDSVYTVDTVLALLAMATAHPEVDALVPIQMSRNGKTPLMTVIDGKGEVVAGCDRSYLDATLVPIRSGHFGLTLLRASKFAAMKRPWFLGVPDSEGRWGDARVDDDIHFWQAWRAAGNNLHCATRCVIGHAELQIMWPSENLTVQFQHASDFWLEGEPRGIWQ